MVPRYPGRNARKRKQHVLLILVPASERGARAPRQQHLLEQPGLLAGQSLDVAGQMTRAVALQQLRDREEEEVPLSEGGAQRLTHYRHLAQGLDP